MTRLDHLEKKVRDKQCPENHKQKSLENNLRGIGSLKGAPNR